MRSYRSSSLAHGRASCVRQASTRLGGSLASILPEAAMSDLLMCPVCLETVEDPHVLPQCGHTFCKRCIGGAAQGRATLRCPTCRQSNQVAQARPNFALRQLLADDATSTSAGTSSRSTASAADQRAAAGEGAVARRVDAGNRDQEHALIKLGVPPSLAELLCDEDKQIGLRIFLLDNSGSTAQGDGKYFYTDERDGRTYSTGCSRWEEISRMAIEQAEWNATIRVPAEFCLLNARGDDGTPYRVDAEKGDVGGQVCFTSTCSLASHFLIQVQKVLVRNRSKGCACS